MNRRHFFALASGLLVPYEPERVYSFLPAWRLLPREFFDDKLASLSALDVSTEQVPNKIYFGGPSAEEVEPYDRYLVSLPDALYARRHSTWGHNAGVIHPSNLLDVQKSAEAFGYPAFRVLST